MRSDKSNRAMWLLYTDGIEPVIKIERCDTTAKRDNNPHAKRNNVVECICCSSTDDVLDVVIGWSNHAEARAKNYGEINDETRSAMCSKCRAILRKSL